MEQGNNKSQGLDKISPQEYAMLEEEAKKTLDTLSEEQISDLRRTVLRELKAFLDYLSSNEKKVSLTVDSIRVYNRTKGSDLTESRIKNKKFWLSKLFNFIAVALFKIPGEFTPTYSFESREKLAVKQYLDKMLRVNTLALKTIRYLKPFLEKIKTDISYDNVKLIVFTNSLYKNRSCLSAIEKRSKDVIRSILRDNDCEYSYLEIENGIRVPEIGDVISKVSSFYEHLLTNSKKYDR